MSQQPGDQFGNYRLVNPIGSGGFATVWLGQHTTMSRLAAIKILSVQLPTPDERINFLKEARFLASLDHPNIVRVLDCDVQNDTPFLVLEYAPNGTLRKRHPMGSRLSLDVMINYVKQIAAGLQYAHDRRLIHRDIKPENMLLGRNDEVLISDFGIAQAMHSVSYLKTQVPRGTPSYMAPEQIEGKAVPASDQYSLGVMVYEWLSGSLPFTGNAVLIRTQQRSKPAQLRDKVPTISSGLEQVVFQALSEDLDARFHDVQNFAYALEQAVNNPNSPVHPLPNNPNNPLIQNNPLGAPFSFSPPNNPPIQNNPLTPPPTIFPNNPPIQNNPLGNPSPVSPNNPPIQNSPLGNPSPISPNNPPIQNNPLGNPSPIPPNNPIAPNPPSGSGIPAPSITPSSLGNAAGANNPLVLPDPAAGGNSSPYNPLAFNTTLGGGDPNAPTVAARPQQPPRGSTQFGSMSERRKRITWFNRIKDRKNRHFVYIGGAVDFMLAVALGIWLNAGDLSWDLWLASLVTAWFARALCAGLTQKYICMALALALAFYWFVGSWALGMVAISSLHIHIIPSHILAILVFCIGALVQIRYVLDNKR